MIKERTDIDIEEENLSRKTASFVSRESARRFFLAYIKSIYRQNIIDAAEEMGLEREPDGTIKKQRIN